MISDKELYYVAVKIFLTKQGKLLIVKDKYGVWDLPGGRIRKDEFEVTLEKVIERKMREELGGKVRYELGDPVVHMRHERIEDAPSSPKIRIFAVGYEAKYLDGEIELPELFTEMQWVDIKTFEPEKYFEGGWLKGVQEYLKNLSRYES